MHRHVKGPGRATPPPQAAPANVHEPGAEQLQSSSMDAASSQAQVCNQIPHAAVCVIMVTSRHTCWPACPTTDSFKMHALCQLCISFAPMNPVTLLPSYAGQQRAENTFLIRISPAKCSVLPVLAKFPATFCSVFGQQRWCACRQRLGR